MPYMNNVGFKDTATSAEAAERTAPSAGSYRELVLAEIQRTGGSTADEVAAAINVSILTVRPRVSELHKAGFIRDTGSLKKNSSGHNAIVWAVTPR